MRNELKEVIKNVRQNEAIIEYMELHGLVPKPFRSIGEVTHALIEEMKQMGGHHAYLPE